MSFEHSFLAAQPASSAAHDTRTDRHSLKEKLELAFPQSTNMSRSVRQGKHVVRVCDWYEASFLDMFATRTVCPEKNPYVFSFILFFVRENSDCRHYTVVSSCRFTVFPCFVIQSPMVIYSYFSLLGLSHSMLGGPFLPSFTFLIHIRIYVYISAPDSSFSFPCR